MMRSARSQALVVHETSHPLPRDFDPLGLQFGMHTWAAIHLLIGSIDCLNLSSQLTIGLGTLTHWTFPPVAVSTHGNLKRLAQDAHGIFLPMGFDELVSHSWPLLKIV